MLPVSIPFGVTGSVERRGGTVSNAVSGRPTREYDHIYDLANRAPIEPR